VNFVSSDTAYAKNALDNQWYDFDDSRVSKINESDVMVSYYNILFGTKG
jgi:hypothetical protein